MVEVYDPGRSRGLAGKLADDTDIPSVVLVKPSRHCPGMQTTDCAATMALISDNEIERISSNMMVESEGARPPSRLSLSSGEQ